MKNERVVYRLDASSYLGHEDMKILKRLSVFKKIVF